MHTPGQRSAKQKLQNDGLEGETDKPTFTRGNSDLLFSAISGPRGQEINRDVDHPNRSISRPHPPDTRDLPPGPRGICVVAGRSPRETTRWATKRVSGSAGGLSRTERVL